MQETTQSDLTEPQTPESDAPVADQTPHPDSTAADQTPAATDANADKTTAHKKPTKKQVRAEVISWLLVLAAGLLRAFAIHSFITPNNFAPGGVTGLATMLNYVTGWNTGIFLFAVNLPLLVVAFFFISKMFAVKSGVSLAMSSLLLWLLERFAFFQYTDEPILASIAGGLVGGVGIAILFRAGGSSGGTDIIATIIQRKVKMAGVSWFIFALDSVVVLASFFVYGYKLTPVLLAFIEMFCSARASDLILSGAKSAIKFEVITTHPEEISQEVIEKLQHSVTKIDATGMYTRDGKALLICIVRRRQIAQFQKIIHNYPDTFAYISTASEVLGKGFSKS